MKMHIYFTPNHRDGKRGWELWGLQSLGVWRRIGIYSRLIKAEAALNRIQNRYIALYS